VITVLGEVLEPSSRRRHEHWKEGKGFESYPTGSLAMGRFIEIEVHLPESFNDDV
jgi:hypothetical protein